MNQPHLQRKLGITEAVSLNMIDMVGIGPFISLPIIMSLMPGKGALLAWLLGALLALCDGLVWSELGAYKPLAGGSYNFLKEIYGKRFGKMFSFLYTWQISMHAPLVVASGAIGFANYFQYLVPLPAAWQIGSFSFPWQQKLVSIGLVLFIYFLLNRNVISTGKISKVLWIVVLVILFFLIGSGVYYFDMNIFHWQPPINFEYITWPALVVLGHATAKGTYCYLGYYNVCHLGGEIKSPEKNIPRSILFSVVGIAILYISLQVIVLGNLLPDSLSSSSFLFSVLVQKWYGVTVAKWFTIFVLWIAASSLFAVVMGYSRVLYAAAADKNFIPVFGKLDEKTNIPHNSLLWITIAGIACSIAFTSVGTLIQFIVVMRIFTQFISQTLGLLWLQKAGIRKSFPFKMFLFPLPAIAAVIIWLFLFITSEPEKMYWAAGAIASGLAVFYVKEKLSAARSSTSSRSGTSSVE